MRLDQANDSHDFGLSLAATRPFDYHAWLATWQREYVFFRIDARQRIDFVSPSVREILGYDPEAMLGQNYQEFFDLDHPLQAQLMDLSDRLVANIPAGVRRCVAQRSDGEIAFFALREREMFSAAGESIGKEMMAQDVTGRVEAELSLRQSEQKYRRLVESVKGDYAIFSLDARGNFTYVSPSAKKVFGYSPEELVGKCSRDLCQSVNESTEMVERVQREAERGVLFHKFVLDIVHADGQPRKLEIQERPIFTLDGRLSAVEGIAKDVTAATAAAKESRDLTEELERRVALRTEQLSRINEELRASEARYRDVVETQTEFIVRWLPDGTRTFVNEAYCRFRNGTPAQLIGTSFLPLVYSEDRGHYAKILASVTPDHPVVTADVRAYRPDGSVAICRWTNRAFFDAAGQAMEYQSVGRDVTDLRTAADLLRQKESHLAHLARLATMGEMVAGIAHEVSQPLHAAKTFAEAARRHLQSSRDGSVEKVVECTAEISQAVTRTVEIIRRLREFTKSRAVKFERLSLNDIVREAVELMSYELRRAGASVRLDLASSLKSIEGDRIQLEQLCVNLLKNACEAMERVPVDQRELSVRTYACGDHACLEIRDSGCGIDGADVERLFDAFYTTKEQGMGMGLSLCKSIAEAHRVKIRCEANGEQPGLTFFLELPIHGRLADE